MTSDTSAEVKGPHSRYDNLQFRLMAITTEGVISQTRAFYPTAHDSDITNDTGILDEEANEGRTKFTNLATPYESKASPGSGLNDLSDKSDISRDNDENIRESIPPEITPEASTKLPKAEEVLDLGSPHIPTFWVEVEEHHGHLQVSGHRSRYSLLIHWSPVTHLHVIGLDLPDNCLTPMMTYQGSAVAFPVKLPEGNTCGLYLTKRFQTTYTASTHLFNS